MDQFTEATFLSRYCGSSSSMFYTHYYQWSLRYECFLPSFILNSSFSNKGLCGRSFSKTKYSYIDRRHKFVLDDGWQTNIRQRIVGKLPVFLLPRGTQWQCKYFHICGFFAGVLINLKFRINLTG